MKRFFIALVLICLCCFATFAQTAFTESSRSYVNVPILKVLEQSEHYIVVYVNNSDKITSVSIPKTWFKQGAEKKATVRLLAKKLSPYMTLNFENGEFLNLYLSMPSSKMDSSWGIFTVGTPLPAEIDPIKVAAGN